MIILAGLRQDGYSQAVAAIVLGRVCKGMRGGYTAIQELG
jgi:hypothetical protein